MKSRSILILASLIVVMQTAGVFRGSRLSAQVQSPSASTAAGQIPDDLMNPSGWARNPDVPFLIGTRVVNSLPETHAYRWDGSEWREVFSLANASALNIWGDLTAVWISVSYPPGGGAAIYRSTDDGATWQEQTLPIPLEDPTAIFGVGDTIWASLDDGRVLRFSIPLCEYSISPAKFEIGPEGGSGVITISANHEACAWVQASAPGFVAATSGVWGWGSTGGVSFALGPNDSPIPRASAFNFTVLNPDNTPGRPIGVVPITQGTKIAVFQQSQSTTANVEQNGFYRLWNYGNSHGWGDGPSPNPRGDGANYGEWALVFDLTAMPKGNLVTGGMLNISWKTSAPDRFPVLHSYPGSIPGSSRQPIKYMTAGASAWLTRLAFSDGYSYTFPASSTATSQSIDLVALGLQSHLERSTQLTVVGTLKYGLARAYLDDDWQDANGWAEWSTNYVRGVGSLTTAATLTVNTTTGK